MKNKIHVVPSRSGYPWVVKKEGNDKPLSQHKTQGAAQQAARPIAKSLKTELVTHGRDGKIRDSDSYGNDPNPPKDRKH